MRLYNTLTRRIEELPSRHLRLYAVPVLVGGRRVGAVVAEVSLTPYEKTAGVGYGYTDYAPSVYTDINVVNGAPVGGGVGATPIVHRNDAVSVADVLFLNVRERAAELVTLQTLGWSDREVATVVALEGATLGVAGSVAGATAGLAFAALLLGVALGPLAAAAGIAIGAGAAAAAVASLLPLTQIRRLAPPAVLAAE